MAVGKITFIMYVYSKRFCLVILADQRETDQRGTLQPEILKRSLNLKKYFKVTRKIKKHVHLDLNKIYSEQNSFSG
jgi:hypothetical protein